MGGMEEREDGKESDPGAARHGNFINYYEFHPPEERLRLLPENFGSRLVPEKGPILVLDVGCNAGVSSSSSSLFQIEGDQPHPPWHYWPRHNTATFLPLKPSWPTRNWLDMRLVISSTHVQATVLSM